MVTYPSTHGVYETGIAELCAKVHDAGGQVYVDGANLNALVGYAKPGRFGADVSHLNLHKTFCIPHGGGGPGVGPVAVRAHLAAYLPGDPLAPGAGGGVGGAARVGGDPADLVGVHPADGPGRAGRRRPARRCWRPTTWRPGCGSTTRCCTPAAKGLVAHECILDLRPITKATGVTVDDVAKRLIDYGFHAPTMSFPVAGTLMVEPTGVGGPGRARPVLRRDDRDPGGDRPGRRRASWPKGDNPLAQRAAHGGGGDGRRVGARLPAVGGGVPGGGGPAAKYWPPVRRIDGAYGDRNLVCACPPPEAFEELSCRLAASPAARQAERRARTCGAGPRCGAIGAAVGEQLTGVLEDDHAVAQQAPALLGEGGQDAGGFVVGRLGGRAGWLVLHIGVLRVRLVGWCLWMWFGHMNSDARYSAGQRNSSAGRHVLGIIAPSYEQIGPARR